MAPGAAKESDREKEKQQPMSGFDYFLKEYNTKATHTRKLVKKSAVYMAEVKKPESGSSKRRAHGGAAANERHPKPETGVPVSDGGSGSYGRSCNTSFNSSAGSSIRIPCRRSNVAGFS